MRQDKMEWCLPSFFSASLSFPSSRSKSNSKVVEGNKISPTLQREVEVGEELRVLPWCTMDAHGHSHSCPGAEVPATAHLMGNSCQISQVDDKVMLNLSLCSWCIQV